MKISQKEKRFSENDISGEAVVKSPAFSLPFLRHPDILFPCRYFKHPSIEIKSVGPSPLNEKGGTEYFIPDADPRCQYSRLYELSGKCSPSFY